MSAEEHKSGSDQNPSGADDHTGTEARRQIVPSPEIGENIGNDADSKATLQSGSGLRKTEPPEAATPNDREPTTDQVVQEGIDESAVGGAVATAVPSDLPAIPGQNSDLTDTGAALEAGTTEVASGGGRGESQRALSVASAHGFRLKMLRWRRQLAEISAMEPTLMTETDALLRKRSLALRYRAMAGERLGSLLREGYALVREAGRRALMRRHYDVLVVGG
ncbi:MAG: preprotein translocase subunit SecA, partial [Rubripirellula sp.]|nr:preprotein translocase subunit SecA [Rubripirellula sp.]